MESIEFKMEGILLFYTSEPVLSNVRAGKETGERVKVVFNDFTVLVRGDRS